MEKMRLYLYITISLLSSETVLSHAPEGYSDEVRKLLNGPEQVPDDIIIGESITWQKKRLDKDAVKEIDPNKPSDSEKYKQSRIQFELLEVKWKYPLSRYSS